MPNQPATDREEGQLAPEQNTSFGDILTEFEQSHTTKAESGQRQATVIVVSGESVFLDIGFKTEGIIPAAEFKDASGNVAVSLGDKFEVTIKGRDPEGYYQLSKLKMVIAKDWSSLENAFAEKKILNGTVTQAIKGGLSVDVGVRAFMPASRSGAKDAAEMEKLVGVEIQVRIIKLDVADEDVVVDRRCVLEDQEREAKEKAFDHVQEGTVVTGTVRSLTEYGAFVDVGGFDGLLHVADISHTRINKPADVLTVNQTVEVQVLKVDRAKHRISLGMKQLLPHPWTLVAEKYAAGQRVQGTVTRTTDFGAFVELEPGIEGLIHLSEMSWTKKVRKPSDVVKQGEQVEVVVLGVSAGERRISLGLKQALGDPWADAAQKYPVGSVVEGSVTSLQKFGAFVTIAEGVEGMVHVGDITAEKRIDHPQDVLKVGQKVTAQVLENDVQRRRLRLGMKQLIPTRIDEYIAEHKEGDVVTGRVADVGKGRIKVDLGEGVVASCGMPAEKGAAEQAATEGKVDLGSISNMLAAKWKGGGAAAASGKSEPVRSGQVRSFRILKLDPATKRIEVEIVG